MSSTEREHDHGSATRDKSGAAEARARRHESRAGTTYARLLRNIADVGGFTLEQAERYAVASITTLEERLAIRDVCNLEAQLPSRLDQILAFQPLIGLPSMTRDQFCERVASRARITPHRAELVAQVVFMAIRSRISHGESRHIEAMLPSGLRSLWNPLGSA